MGIVRRVFELTGLTVLLDDGSRPARVAGGGRRRGSGEARVGRHPAGAELSVADMFVAFFAPGGAADRGQLVAYLDGDTEALDRHQLDTHEIHAVNERLGDVGLTDQLLSYASA